MNEQINKNKNRKKPTTNISWHSTVEHLSPVQRSMTLIGKTTHPVSYQSAMDPHPPLSSV